MLTRTDKSESNSDAYVAQNEPAQSSPTASKSRTLIAMLSRGALQIILMVAVLAVSLFMMNRLIDSKPEVRKRPGFRTVYTVETMAVSLADNQPNFKVYGEAIASRTVDLRSLVSGEVKSVHANLKAGARVNEGDALVKIDSFNYDGALREAEANKGEVLAKIQENMSRIELEKSKFQRLTEQLELARNDHKRISSLRKKGTTTQKQLDDRSMILSQRAQAAEQSEITLQTENAKLEQQKASLTRLEWRVQLAERNILNTTLKAPFDGIVRSTGAEIGKTVSANDVVVSIYEDEKIDVRFTLTDERYGRLQTDEKGLLGREIVVIWAIGGQHYNFPATIDRVGAEISSNRGGVEVYATLQQVKDNPTIRPGAFVEIHVPDIQFKNTTIIPETALYNGDTVYMKSGDTLVSKTVNVLAYNDGSVIISGDFQNGDRVLITRIAEISDGIKVREQGAELPKEKQGKSKADSDKDQ